MASLSPFIAPSDSEVGRTRERRALVQSLEFWQRRLVFADTSLCRVQFLRCSLEQLDIEVVDRQDNTSSGFLPQ